MALVVKRKLDQSWREAVAARADARGRLDHCLSEFDRRIAEGEREVDAAYRALESGDCLWRVDLPGETKAVQVERGTTKSGPHDIPAV